MSSERENVVEDGETPCCSRSLTLTNFQVGSTDDEPGTSQNRRDGAAIQDVLRAPTPTPPRPIMVGEDSNVEMVETDSNLCTNTDIPNDEYTEINPAGPEQPEQFLAAGVGEESSMQLSCSTHVPTEEPYNDENYETSAMMSHPPTMFPQPFVATQMPLAPNVVPGYYYVPQQSVAVDQLMQGHPVTMEETRAQYEDASTLNVPIFFNDSFVSPSAPEGVQREWFYEQQPHVDSHGHGIISRSEHFDNRFQQQQQQICLAKKIYSYLKKAIARFNALTNSILDAEKFTSSVALVAEVLEVVLQGEKTFLQYFLVNGHGSHHESICNYCPESGQIIAQTLLPTPEPPQESSSQSNEPPETIDVEQDNPPSPPTPSSRKPED